MYKWTLGVGAVNCGAELTRLGATDHGAEVPRSHNHLANLASDVALGSAPWILAPRSAPPFSAPSPFYHRAKGAVNPFDRAARPLFTPPQPSPPSPPSSLPAGAARRRPRSKAPGPGAVVVAPPPEPGTGAGRLPPRPRPRPRTRRRRRCRPQSSSPPQPSPAVPCLGRPPKPGAGATAGSEGGRSAAGRCVPRPAAAPRPEPTPGWGRHGPPAVEALLQGTDFFFCKIVTLNIIVIS